MQGTARGTYRTTGWRQQEYGGADAGPKLTLAEKDLALEGELEGSAVGRSSLVTWGTGSSAAIGHVRFTGSDRRSFGGLRRRGEREGRGRRRDRDLAHRPRVGLWGAQWDRG